MKLWIKFLSKIITIAVIAILVIPANSYAENTSNLFGSIGDYGTWMTEDNVDMFRSEVQSDLTKITNAFERTQMVADYVPIEARLGLVFMNAMSWLGKTLNDSLGRFISIFIILGYTFWLAIEAYIMMTTTSDVNKFAKDAVKNGLLVIAWFGILHLGIANLFGLIAAPILAIGQIFADLILNSIVAIAHVQLPDTCNAIQAYTAANTGDQMLLDAETAASIMCLPTRMSGFFVTTIFIGLKWICSLSLLGIVFGAAIIIISVMSIWKFALIALGVIADLFLVLLLLPFTAIAETLGKIKFSDGSGIVGEIWTGLFQNLFKTQSLTTQLSRFINASIYFVALSIMVALCAALLSGIVTRDSANVLPTMDNLGFLGIILVLCLVLHLVTKMEQWAQDLGGSIDSSLGQKFGDHVVTLSKGAWGQRKNVGHLAKMTWDTGVSAVGATKRAIGRGIGYFRR